MPTKLKKYGGPSVIFRGHIAVQKLLLSAHIHATKIAMYKGKLGSVWEADTDRGKRWVSHNDEAGWKISKTPPVAAQASQ
jgi:hypothetical protein